MIEFKKYTGLLVEYNDTIIDLKEGDLVKINNLNNKVQKGRIIEINNTSILLDISEPFHSKEIKYSFKYIMRIELVKEDKSRVHPKGECK